MASDNSNLPSLRPYPMYRTFRYRDVLGSFSNEAQKSRISFSLLWKTWPGFCRRRRKVRRIHSIRRFAVKAQSVLGKLSKHLRTDIQCFTFVFGSLPTVLTVSWNGRTDACASDDYKTSEQQGYYTSFYYGGNANFDLQDMFLEQQGIDFILINFQFSTSYQHSAVNEKGVSWGYDDADVFMHSLKLSMHRIISTVRYLSYLKHTRTVYSAEQGNRTWKDSKITLRHFPFRKIKREYAGLQRSILYTSVFWWCAPSIFFGMSKTERLWTNYFLYYRRSQADSNPARRANRSIPCPIYYLLTDDSGPRKFSSVSTHADVTPTVLSFLYSNYGIEIPQGIMA